VNRVADPSSRTGHNAFGICHRIGPKTTISGVPYAQPMSGAALVATAGLPGIQLNPASSLASLSVTMPPNASDGETFYISTTQVVTALTVSAAAGQTLIGGGPFVLEANGVVRWIYRAANSTWYPN